MITAFFQIGKKSWEYLIKILYNKGDDMNMIDILCCFYLINSQKTH